MPKYLSLLWLLLSVNAFANPQIKFETSLGEFVIELDSELAPITSENFLHYVQDGSYIGSLFHRVIPGFMAQGGGFDAEFNQLPTRKPIINEANNGLKNELATIAMARTAAPNSATRQFFINLTDNPFLDANQRQAGYAVFGRVISGFETIEQMATIPTHSVGRMADVPTTPIVITDTIIIN